MTMKLNEILNSNGGTPLPPARGSEATRDNKKTKITCPCCHGQRTQYSQKLGMRDLCPACEGRGWIENPDL